MMVLILLVSNVFVRFGIKMFNFSCILSFGLLLLKDVDKKMVIELEKHMHLKCPEFCSKFYSNRRNFYIHLEFDKSLFSFENYKLLVKKLTVF